MDADNPNSIIVTHVGKPDIPDHLPALILTNQVVFPLAVVPLKINEKSELQLLEDVSKEHRILALLTRRSGMDDTQTGIESAYEVGCIARLLQAQPGPDGVNLLVQAMRRFRVGGVVQRTPYPVVKVVSLETTEADMEEPAPLVASVKNQMIRLIHLSPNIPDGAAGAVESIDEPAFLADLIATNLSIPISEKQKLLETLSTKERLERLLYLLTHEVEILELSNKIQAEVKNSIEDSQREYFLRQQLKAIRNALGEGDSDRPELEEYRRKLETLGLKEEVRKEAFRELDRLGKMNEASAEYHVITTYLDWLTDLPWNISTEDRLDLEQAENVLDEDHYGLNKVKKRILEYLAVRKLKPDAPGPILCFLGPPGVGKTSLGKSIARTMGRNFVRMSLGGVRDEAEIRGHRKTYVGALPGRIIQGIRKAGSNNPVFMLDELDKVGNDFRGDPSSALLEVLDPAQNDTFQDHYLNVPFDLSKVMFIATANMIDTIPWALRDRMEVIELPGYTMEEKIEIAKRYLVPRQLEAHGIKRSSLSFTQTSLKSIIGEYTQEAGVRNLEREVANVCRVRATELARGKTGKVSIKPENLIDYLGKPRVHHEMADRASIPGVATGLAWTAAGGNILFIEATRMPGKGNLILTGQLGDVMKESASTVISYIRANADRLGIDGEQFSSHDIHIHVPAGAVPKDGPSAGVTILTAVVSLLTGRRVKNRLAMTGEITLRGLVLPVGGIKEKVLAAVRAGVREIILPQRCARDLDDVPESARAKVTFHFVERMEQVIELALGISML